VQGLCGTGHRLTVSIHPYPAEFRLAFIRRLFPLRFAKTRSRH
jgi:hypothetical protein